MDEERILGEIFKRFGRARSKRVRVGVGDDAALIRIGRTGIVMTQDAVVEGIDFDLRYFSWPDVGFKALSAAVSDVYACGASPRACLVTAGIPKGARLSQIRGLLSGLASAAAFHRAPIVGGDLSRSPKWFIDVFVAGEPAGEFKSRSGARPGDAIFLSGDVGASRAALCLWDLRKSVPGFLRRAHLRPRVSRVAGIELGKERRVSAMMDVSDGLLLDLHRLCKSSGVSASLLLDRLPIHRETRNAFRALGKDPVRESAIGGEDYVLLFTVRPPVPKWISNRYACIGRIRQKGPAPGALYNMERRGPVRLSVKGFLHRF